jgi:hypothetical protein
MRQMKIQNSQNVGQNAPLILGRMTAYEQWRMRKSLDEKEV